MGGYLIVQPLAARPEAVRLAGEIRNLARASGLTDKDLNADAWIATEGPHHPPVCEIGGWRLVGDVIDRRRPTFAREAGDATWDYERKMLARLWGRFIGVRFGAKGRIDAILRDPSGALDCVAWCHDDLLLIASSPPSWLLDRLPPDWRIAPDRLAAALRNPVLAVDTLLFEGPIGVAPGCIQPLPLDQPASTLWSASDFARRSLAHGISLPVAEHRLRSAIEEAVTGLSSLGGPLASEVSGGLDSSLVAAALVNAHQDIRLWLNAYGATPESDERRWTTPLARRLGIDLVSTQHTRTPLSGDLLEGSNQGIRPGLAALDAAHDLDWANRLQVAGVNALMTGKGGDSVLMQGAGADVFTDLWLRRGWRAALSREGRAVALATERSLWSLAEDAKRFRQDGGRPPSSDDGLLPPAPETSVATAWKKDAAAFGPAKAWQIAGVRDNINRHGPSRLTERIDVRHPLCAQPVVEACLAIPSHLLVLNGRDRGLARHAFRDSLPPEILDRRSKGDMSRIYGKIVLDHLPFLRPWLMEGRLASLGVIDPATADRILTRESLIWRGHYGPILTAAAFEAWVRVWERRLSLHPSPARAEGSPRAISR